MTLLLEVEGLKTSFFTAEGELKAVDGVSLSLDAGEILGLVGESGSGKSVTGYSILGLVDPPGRITGGRIRFEGRDITALNSGEWRVLRGRRVAMVFQDPMMTLNPVLRIGRQMTEALRAHAALSRSETRQRLVEALGRAGIPAPEERLDAYPHQLSGGMRQRVAIAIALLHQPALIIADEPTTALDVTIQGQILAQVQRLCRESGTALIWITHDLSVVAGLAERIAVMYAGRIVETGSVEDVLDRPRHPYTRGLIGSVPQPGEKQRRLPQIPGRPPVMTGHDSACSFLPRCARASAACADAPAPARGPGGREVRCHHPEPERAA